MGFWSKRFFMIYELVIIAWHPKTSLSRLDDIGWLLGFMTGKRSGVSTVALRVFSLPILPSRSFSFISNMLLKEVKPTAKAHLPYKKMLAQKVINLDISPKLKKPTRD
jgi:hypothetical protein